MGNWEGYQNALDVNIVLLCEYIFGQMKTESFVSERDLSLIHI